MRYLQALLLFLIAPYLMTGCSTCVEDEYVGVGEWEQKINSGEIVHAVQHVLSYLRHEKHLRLEDSNVYYNNTVHALHMEFISQDILEVREARFLIVDLVEALLAEMNRNPIIAPDLLEYPMTADQLEIYINFESFYDRYVDPYYVGCIMVEDGLVTYYATTIKALGRNKWDFRTEPYTKSLELTVYEREAEHLFEDALNLEYPHPLNKDQYFTPEKVIPRYFSPYRQKYIFDR